MPDPMAPGWRTPMATMDSAVAHLIDAGEDPVVLAAHDRCLAVLADALEVEVEGRAAVRALGRHGAAVGFRGGRRGPLEVPVLGPLRELLVAPHDLVLVGVDVVVGAAGVDPQ